MHLRALLGMTDPATQLRGPEYTKENAEPGGGQHCCCGWVTPAGHGLGVLRVDCYRDYDYNYQRAPAEYSPSCHKNGLLLSEFTG
jgi:hypothetical protein